jgi:hypothetical protein
MALFDDTKRNLFAPPDPDKMTAAPDKMGAGLGQLGAMTQSALPGLGGAPPAAPESGNVFSQQGAPAQQSSGSGDFNIWGNAAEPGGFAGSTGNGAPSGGGNIAGTATTNSGSGGYKPPFLLGFETSKLMDPNSGANAGSKYTDAAKAFGQAYLGGTGIARGQLGDMLNAVKAQFPNARAVGDDKIDFGDGNGPIDVIGSDGTVRFQNTTDNAQWEANAGAGAFGQGAQQMLATSPHGGGTPMPAQQVNLPPASTGSGPVGPSAGQYTFSPVGAAQDFTPTAVSGPEALNVDRLNAPGAISADQVAAQQAQGGAAVNPERITAPGAVGTERIMGQTIGGPERIAAQQVQGPGALTARNVNDPTGFQNLTAEQLQQDPSYRFRLQQGLGAMQNSAAAKGLLRTGGTLKGLSDYAGQSASQEYQAANERNRQTYQQNVENQANAIGQNNQAQAQAYGLTNQYQQAAALANQGANLSAAQYNSQAAQQQGMFNAGQNQSAQAANAAAANQAGQFNAGMQFNTSAANQSAANQAAQFNSGQSQQANQFNAAAQNQAALANQGANLQAGQFNAGMAFNTQAQNAQNQIAAYNAYQPLRQQASQFNAAQQAAAAQNNLQNRFAVDQFNATGGLNQFNANLGAELGRGNLANQQAQTANSYNLGVGNLALGNRQTDQSYNLGLGNLGVSQGQLALAGQGQSFNQGLQTFNTNYGTYRDNRDTAFAQQLALTQIGANQAGNYANQAGGAYTNQGNANAGAAIAGGNVWAGALGNIGNTAQQAGFWNYNGQQPVGPNGQTWDQGTG